MLKVMKKGIVLPLLLILASAALILAAFFLLDNKSKTTTHNPTQTSSPSPSDETIHTDEGSANWKTYTNSKYKYSFKYPPDLELKEIENGVILNNEKKLLANKVRREDYIGVGIVVDKAEPNISLEEYLNNRYPKNNYGLPAFEDFKTNVEPIIVDQITGLILLPGLEFESENNSVWVKKESSIYKISAMGYETGDTDTEKAVEVFYRILWTFKFLDQPEEAKFCGGIAGIICHTGYECLYDGDYPDAGGKCVEK